MKQRGPREQLEGLSANARKSFSQNFLTSPHWTAKLAESCVADPAFDEAWEIGPGLLAITEQLGNRLTAMGKPLRLFEIDRKLAENARQRFPEAIVHEGDFLDAEIAPLADNRKIALLSNLPFHLSSPILFRLLEERRHFTRLVLTFQKEVAERLRAIPRTKPYGGLSVLTQLCFEIRSLGVIPPGAFYPVPEVDSEALLLLPRPALSVSYERLREIVKAAFLHRRKKVTSNLSNLLPKQELTEFLLAHGLTENARAEELKPDLYLALTERFPSMV